MNIYLFNFYDVYFATIEENTFPIKKEYLSRNDRPEIEQHVCNRSSNSTNSLQNYDQRTRSGR